MDIINSKYVFFLRKNNIKLNGFDSYSKNSNDILTHYNLKYEELSDNLKSPQQYKAEKWKYICSKFDNEISEIEKYISTPFELYITAFLLAFDVKYEKSIVLFQKCQALLPDTLYGNINVVFINLQIAQLYERIGLYHHAFSILIKTRYTISKDKELFYHVHNFYASSCVSIGMLCFRYFNTPNIAKSCILTSIIIRTKYKHTYMPSVYKHYIAQAYRYIAMMSYDSHKNAYLFLQTSYKIRQELLQIYLDDVTQEEMFHLETDFIIFLIRNQFKTSFINLHSKSLLKLIAGFSPKLREQLYSNVQNIASMLYRYYSFFQMKRKAKLWYNMMNYK